jgi:hypothetical protein
MSHMLSNKSPHQPSHAAAMLPLPPDHTETSGGPPERVCRFAQASAKSCSATIGRAQP